MTVVKPKSDHPWHGKIRTDVDTARIRARIAGLKERIRELQTELKELQRSLPRDAGNKRKSRPSA
jgi:hypothetical protein